MIKLKSSMLLTAAATTLLVSSVFAGGPTAEPMQAAPQYNLFATAEGGYTWNEFGNANATYTINSVVHSASVAASNSGGTGRVAVGVIHNSTSVSNLSYTAEMGGGYYGETEYGTSSTLISEQDYVYGLDLLAGVDYQFDPMFDVFFKAGGLLQNIRTNSHVNLDSAVSDVVENQTQTTSSVVPEVKLGGIYNVTNVWGLSLSYLHVFGNDTSMDITKTVNSSGGTTYSSLYSTSTPVTLNTLLVGVQYKFS